jgi:hypothetical protein
VRFALQTSMARASLMEQTLVLSYPTGAKVVVLVTWTATAS